MFAFGLGHLFLIGRNPDGPRRFKFRSDWQSLRESMPQLLRSAREGELRFGVVHHDNMAHARSRRSAAKNVSFYQRDM
jgi:hypothetical protein